MTDKRIGITDLMRGMQSVTKKAGTRRLQNYILTETGRVKAEEYGGKGKEYEILNHLLDNGPSTKREIADGIQMEDRKLQIAIDRLIGAGLIMPR